MAAASVANFPPHAIAVSTNDDASTGASDDPFVTNPQQPAQSHRYSAFDSQLFNLNASSSPNQAKRALEAHLAETERRLQETSKLGTNLVNQRAQLSEKLKEVEKQQHEAEIGPELRQKLIELEKEYNEVGRDSVRAFLAPKSRLAAGDDVGPTGTPGVGPATYSSQATASPTKFSVPPRKQRNQPSSRVDNIEFATEISTSLLAQVRQLQVLLAERDESLKNVTLEKSRLELEAEGFTQRLKALDESEQRYKDENWSLETQTHELIAAVKDSEEREKKLTTSLGSTTSEKQKAQRDLDEIKQSHGRLIDEYDAKQKAHDTELHTLRRNMATGDTERSTLQKKVEELTSQNQELAKAVASRLRNDDVNGFRDLGSEDEAIILRGSSPEHSPPPSPSKGTPRHNHLESETLKSSLHHAHRMIQNLKGNIHREKTEKIELKRLLQESRDELELRRGEPGGPSSGSKRQKSKTQDTFKKPLRPGGILGAGRASKTEIEMEEPDWEDHAGENSPSQAASSRYLQVDTSNRSGHPTDFSDAYQTANETEDAFETANERETGTESEAFQTGAESLAGDSSDELTETEQSVDRTGTIRAKKPLPISLTQAGNRTSYMSTASTSAGEDEEGDLRTPVQNQMPRYRLKMNRGKDGRRSRFPDEIVMLDTPGSNKDSPASFASNQSPPTQAGQSLFAELGGLNGEDAEFGTPGKSSIYSERSTPGPAIQSPLATQIPTQQVDFVHSSMQTEPWEPVESKRDTVLSSGAAAVGGLLAGGAVAHALSDSTDSSTQYTPQKSMQGHVITPPKTAWDESVEKSRSASLGLSPLQSQYTKPEKAPAPHLAFSPLGSEHIEPKSPVQKLSSMSKPLALSNIHVQETAPITPVRSAAQNAPVTTDQRSVGPETPIVTQTDDIDSRPKTAEKTEAKSGIFGSLFARGKGRRGSQPSIAEDQTPQTPRDQPRVDDTPLPFRDISTNVVSEKSETAERIVNPVEIPIMSPKSDQGSQTILSSDQIDHILMEKNKRPVSGTEKDKAIPDPTIVAPLPSVTTPPRAQRSRSQPNPPEVIAKEPLTLQTTPKRPGSANSQRMSMNTYPPLPADHKKAIEAAHRISSGGVATATGSVMGPPLAPASAYRVNSRMSQRSVDNPQSPNSKAGTTPRARRPASRHSSVSSFASELDERFNIRPNEFGGPQGFEPGTDPRMIQAITQTMIGEFLWKYTRKAGRPEMSSTRHRRYFWVHPYTRTLYWSDQDPQAAGRGELKAKSVAIEAVRVISDDNPMPPGLHRKSLEVITPGRKIRFTASTGQRHETWFNALSYLLLRTNGPQENEPYTAEDVSEFNPRAYGSTVGRSRPTAPSLSSYNSRGTRTSTVHRAHSTTSASRQPLNHTLSDASARSSQQPQLSSTPTDSMNARQGSISRLSNMFKQGTIRGSFSSRRSRADEKAPQDGSIYDASLVHDSTEDLPPAEPVHESEGLENVRACCDGKHDVSSLSRTGRHGSHAGRHSHTHGVSSMGSRHHH